MVKERGVGREGAGTEVRWKEADRIEMNKERWREAD